jgi:murein DD-endopeptidase MepM/ murein hydrolase activator NlpD
MTDHGTHRGSTFKWIVSTMLAGVVGIGAIGTVIYASLKADTKIGAGDMVSELRHIGAKALTPFKPLLVNRQLGPRFATSKSDRLVVTAKGLSTRYIIHDTVAREKDRRQYVSIKPYVRMVSTLATARPDAASDIPTLDPLKLYANLNPLGDQGDATAASGGLEAATTQQPLPIDIGADDETFRRSDASAQELVAAAAADEMAGRAAAEGGDEGAGGMSGMTAMAGAEVEHNTTTIARTPTGILSEDDDSDSREEVISEGDTVASVLQDAGVSAALAQHIISSMNRVYPAAKVKIGERMRFVLASQAEDRTKVEPVEVSLYDDEQHLVTVTRGEDGEYIASSEPAETRITTGGSHSDRATLYQSFYEAALLQSLSPALILKLLRIHAYDTDLKRPTQPGDGFEAFFDTAKDGDLHDNTPNELLFTSIVVDGEKRGFYRFRTPDGTIDYYDHDGNSVKKFLMRKPVRGDRVRLASGFGYRMHPLLRVSKLHTGTDWAGPVGTPVLAAGSGTVEFIGTKGTYGNYVRIRHANGYKTAYAHLKAFADGLQEGLQVSQGQVIGYLGNSGRSTGPHLHFEVMVNNAFVDSMTIPVPRGAKLAGHMLAQFIRERDRIDELMSRDPVNTKVASAH